MGLWPALSLWNVYRQGTMPRRILMQGFREDISSILVEAAGFWQGKDPFHAYQLPRAITLLRQGLGRLIRSGRDYGIMALMDSRGRYRGYGRTIQWELRPHPPSFVHGGS